MSYPETIPGCCAFSFDGHHCHHPGTFTTSTSGGGKWLCRIHSQPKLEPEAAIAAMYDSHRLVPAPDYSLAARRQASDQRAWAAIPDTLKGGSPDEYRAVIYQGILDLIGKTATNRRAA